MKPTEPRTERVWIIGPNLHDQSKGTFRAHAAGCADVPREQRRNGGAPTDTMTARTQLEVAEFIYPRDEFEWKQESSYLGDIHFAPCLDALPVR